MSVWDDEKVAALRKGLEEGSTYGELTLLPVFSGISRNALIGKAQRLGLASNGKDGASIREARSRKRQAAVEEARRAKMLVQDDTVAKQAVAKLASSLVGFGFRNNARVGTPAEVEKAAVTRDTEMSAIKPIISCEPVSFHDLRDHHCKMPLWQTGSRPTVDEMRFCGRKPLLMKSWCAECELRVYPPRGAVERGRAA